MFIINKKIAKKGVDFCACTRGCDVALGATWLCHVDTRACLRGTDVTWTRIYIYYIYYFIVDTRACLRGADVTWTHIYIYYIYYFIKYTGLPIIERQIINRIKSSTLYTD